MYILLITEDITLCSDRRDNLILTFHKAFVKPLFISVHAYVTLTAGSVSEGSLDMSLFSMGG